MGFCVTAWEEYLTEAIELFREEFGSTFSGGEQEYIRKRLFYGTLLEPCQMEIFELKVEKGAIAFVLHKTNLADMLFNVHTEATMDDIRSFYSKENGNLKLSSELTEQLLVAPTESQLFVYTERWMFVSFLDVKPKAFAHLLARPLRNEIKDAQVKNIEKTTKELKKSIPKIPQKDRNEFLEYATKIDTALQEIAKIDAKVSEEIGGVRKIIGASKEFQDFRVFTTDVEDLKKTHVPKDVFVSEVKRLDEKIDKGLEGLNTRIEDLKAIKFWSKRTLLEIALAILAALATLYGAGVLKF
jgi:hypothetical protein